MFSTEIKTARCAAGLSGREVARRAGISSAYYSQMETGARGEPPEPLKSRVLEILGATVASTLQANGLSVHQCLECKIKDARIAELEHRLDVANDSLNNLSRALAQGRTGVGPASGASCGNIHDRSSKVEKAG